MEYLGFDISARGVEPSQSKIDAVASWPRPTSVKDVRSFLGLASFYRRFVKGFSQIARPLTDLTRDTVEWHWSEQEERAFNQLKQALVSAPILRFPDFSRNFVVTTDADATSVGAILEQDFGQGLQPIGCAYASIIAYASKKLTPPEQR